MIIPVWLALPVAALATYRTAIMLAKEEGPFEAFEKFRNLFLADNWIGRGVRCPHCVSMHVGILFTAAVYFGLTWLLVPFALSGVTIVLDKYWSR